MNPSRWDLGGDAILCFSNGALEQDCLIEFKDSSGTWTPWHHHDEFLATDRQGYFIELNYLDLLTGLKEGKVLVCERWKSGLLEDRWLIHSEFNCDPNIYGKVKSFESGEHQDSQRAA